MIDEKNFTFSYLEKYLVKEIGIKKIDEDILKTLRLSDSQGNFNFAAKLLADVNNELGLDIARIGNDIDYILDRKALSGISLLEQYDKAIEYYQQYYQFEQIKGAKRIKHELIPEEAYREAIANAIVHREYDIKASIRIAMYKDYIEICSPGGLVEGVSEEDYLNGNLSILRNPIIGDIFNRLNLIERFGTGVKRILKSYKDSRKKPKFILTDNIIKIILPCLDYDELDGEYKDVYQMMDLGLVTTASQVADSMNWGKSKATSILNSLVEKGYVTIVGRGRGTKYKQSR